MSHWLLDIEVTYLTQTLGMFVERWAQEKAVSHLVSPGPMVQNGLLIDGEKNERTCSGEATVVVSYQLGKCSYL